MNLKKTLSSAALLLASTALLSASSFAVVATAVGAPTLTPSALPTSGSGATAVYAAPLTVTIAPAATLPAGTVCWYTTDGSAPVTSGVVSTTAVSCTSGASVTLTDAASAAIAKKFQAVDVPLVSDTAHKISATTSQSFKIESTITAPVLTPAHTSGIANVQITDSWSYTSATGLKTLPTIYYTTDLSDPRTSGTAIKYAPKTTITINTASTILKAAAVATGFEPSAITSGTYDDGTASGIQFFVGAGSSAQFNEFALAAGGPLGEGTGGICGAHHFTAKNAAQVADVRSGVTPADTGHLSLVWDNNTAPTTICAYVNLDSTLGVKAFMASNLSVPGAFINILNSTTAGNMLDPFWAKGGATTQDESSIPAAVLTAIQGQPFNAAVTDIRPEDAKFATTRAIGALNAARTGLGYGPGPIGSAILEASVSGTSRFNVVNFALSGADPISAATQNPYTTINVGAAPVVVFVNTLAPTADGLFHFGDASVTNIGRFTLAGYLNGSITRTTALAQTADATSAAAAPVHVFLREPLSGTYNVMEFNVPASKEIGSSQEVGVNPKVIVADLNGNTGNPMNITVGVNSILVNPLGTVNSTGKMLGLLGASRQRAIGTGDMVKVVAKVTGCTFTEAGGVITPSGTCVGGDKLGYAFWGYGNFSAGNNDAAYTTKYLTVDGVDPINETYTNGAFPICDATNFTSLGGHCPAVPFTNVINGSYPIWTMYRVVTKSPAPALVSAVVTQAQDNSVVGVVRDFVPTAGLKVFRSHYNQAGVTGSNGHAGSEAGGDMGGAVYLQQEDYDHILDFGTEILQVKQ
jgi:hypothetical protein